jgi:hypothetical protein
MLWKITNTSQQPIKVALAKSNISTTGVILQPGQFTICDSRMTSSLDAQRRRKYVSIEENYSNPFKLNMCEAYNEDDIKNAIEQVNEYSKK